MNEEDFNNDEELAPMVDGLSGALCVLILISTVFMISSTTKVFEELTGGALRFRESIINNDSNVINFKEGLTIDESQKQEINKRISNSNGDQLIVYGYMPENVKNRKNKNIFNLLYFKSNINTKKKISLKNGDQNMCNKNESCIYWEVK
ncbi:TPA: hypothetical protein KD868_003683 [Vibrio parahaemolyticus]|nr:hypothetical protein [Vibrio parahaemolyticus]